MLMFGHRLRLALLVAIVLSTSFYTLRANDEAPTAPSSSAATVGDWIRENAIPIESDDPQSSNDDLVFLKEFIGDARIVSLGEATHGTREMFRLKHRLVKFMVQEMGFTHFGIEASLPDCRALSAYVLYGTGDPEEALHGQGFWTWDTEEVLDLIKWMRHHNEQVEDGRKIRFFGYDMQNPRKAARDAVAYLHEVGSADTQSLERQLDTLLPDNSTNFWRVYEDYSIPQRDSLREFAKTLIGAMDRLTRDSSTAQSEGWPQARLSASVVRQCESMMRTEKMYQPSIGVLEWYRIYSSFGESAALLADLLQNEGPPLADSLTDFLVRLRQPETIDAYENLPSDQERAKWREMSRLAVSELERNSARYRGDVGDSAFEVAHNAAQDIVLAWQSLDEYMAMPENRPNIRDASMAENISWMLSDAGPDARIILWAHNLHVTRKPAEPGYGSMGSELERTYGDDHIVIGFSFNKGSFQAAFMDTNDKGQTVQKLGVFTVDEAADSTIAGLFATAEIPLFLIDAGRIPSSGIVHDWFSRERLMRSIGAGYSYDNVHRYFEPVVLPDHFDAVIFVDSTTAARPNRRTQERFHMTD